MNLEDATLKVLREEEAEVAPTYKVDFDTIMNLAIAHIKHETNINVTEYSIVDDGVNITIPVSASHKIPVLLDLLNVKDESNALTNDKLNQVKAYMDSLVTEALGSNHQIKFDGIHDSFGDIVFIEFEVIEPTIDAKISLTYKLYDEGFTSMHYGIQGDLELDEYWSTSNCTPEQLVDVLQSVKAYYETKH